MKDFEKCVTYRRNGDRCVIACKLGLWSVEGPFGMALIHEAMHYFEQYKRDGEYRAILGDGKEP